MKKVQGMRSLPYPKIWKMGSFFSIGVLLFTLYFLLQAPELGLKILWDLLIPIAPLIFFFFPNIWVSVCPLAILQGLTRGIGERSRLRMSYSTNKTLHDISWMLLYLLVPARVFLFNHNADIVVGMILGLGLVAFTSGVIFEGLGGWCMGICPIRPVEMLYGQFSREAHRPEQCLNCHTCQVRCSRLFSHNLKLKTENMAPFINQIMSFPGFVLGYFLSGSSDPYYLVYFKCFSLALIGWFLIRILVKNNRTIFSGFISVCIYYGFSIYRIGEAWSLPGLLIVVLYILVTALLVLGIKGILNRNTLKRPYFFG